MSASVIRLLSGIENSVRLGRGRGRLFRLGCSPESDPSEAQVAGAAFSDDAAVRLS